MDDAQKRCLMEANRSQSTFEEATKRMQETGEEFCVSCLKGVGFPARTHIDHPVRYASGAYYVEGGGQLCSPCGTASLMSSNISAH